MRCIKSRKYCDTISIQSHQTFPRMGRFFFVVSHLSGIETFFRKWATIKNPIIQCSIFLHNDTFFYCRDKIFVLASCQSSGSAEKNWLCSVYSVSHDSCLGISSWGLVPTTHGELETHKQNSHLINRVLSTKIIWSQYDPFFRCTLVLLLRNKLRTSWSITWLQIKSWFIAGTTKRWPILVWEK